MIDAIVIWVGLMILLLVAHEVRISEIEDDYETRISQIEKELEL